MLLQEVGVPLGKVTPILTPYMEKIREELSILRMGGNNIAVQIFLRKIPRAFVIC
jgi:hypothetical protein